MKSQKGKIMFCHSHGPSHHGQKWKNCKKQKSWNQGRHKSKGHRHSFSSSRDVRILMHKKHMHHDHQGDYDHNLYHPCQRHFNSCLGRIHGFNGHHTHHHCHHGCGYNPCRDGSNHNSSTVVEGSANIPQPPHSCSYHHNQQENCRGNKTMVDKAVGTDTENDNQDST